MKSKGITLIALIITIILLLILVGVAISTLSNNGIFERTKEARDKYQNAQNEEEMQIAEYSNEIDIQSSSNRLTGNSGSKNIVWSNEENEYIKQVDLTDYNCHITDFDFLLVYYSYNGGNNDNFLIDTSKDYTMMASYTYGSWYLQNNITTNIENNTVTLSVGGNSGWGESSRLTTIIGINL